MKSINLLVFLFAFSTIFARQVTQSPVLPAIPKTLTEQYRALSADCEIINGVRMMKLYKMDQFWKSVQDSVTGKSATITNLQAVIVQQKSEINQLKNLLVKSEAEKAELALKVDNINVFGTHYSKSGFVGFAAVVVVSLVALLVVLGFMYKISFGSAHEFRKINEALNQEFEDYKHKAIEKEIKISRELQNYRNRMAELKSA